MSQYFSILLAVLSLLIFSACERGSEDKADFLELASTFLNLDPAVEYVGDEECALCHSEIFKTFKQNGMGRSFYLATPDNVIEDYAENNNVIDERTQLHYKMYRRGDEFFQLEYRLDDNNQLTHGLGRKVDYIIGSGNHTRSYITRENDLLFEMPVTWYSDKGKWDLSPGYDHKNLRFSRPIVPECMNCHNSYAEHVEHSENRYTDVPLGIGCERCHGPGQLHVEMRSNQKFQASKLDQLDSTIVNPTRLPLDYQIDVCRQCHLQGDMLVYKQGKKVTDFRPGMFLRDVKSIYVRDDVADGDFRIASHGARISLSACFTESGGQLTCTRCHDPHKPLKSVERGAFNEVCLDCHEPATLHASKMGTDCIRCHMRQGTVSDVLHVNFTDHWIRKDIEERPQQDINKPKVTKDKAIELRDFFAETDEFADERLAIAYVKYFESHHGVGDYLQRALDLLKQSQQKGKISTKGRLYLGLAYKHLGRLAEAEKCFRDVLRVDEKNAKAYFELGFVAEEQGNFSEAAEAYSASLDIFPENHVAFNNLGNVKAALNDYEAALAAYRHAIELSPGYAAAYKNLGDLHFYKLNDSVTGEKMFQQAIKLQPDFTTALFNLANVHLLRKDDVKALQLFKSVIDTDPGFIAAYGNIALIYSNLGERQKAIEYLRRVLEIDSKDSRALKLLAELETEASN